MQLHDTMKKHNSSYTNYEVITQQDDNGDLLIPLPAALLKALDWKPGDEIQFDVDGSGNYVLSKADT